MSWRRQWWRLREWFHRDWRDHDLEEEMRAHVEMEEQENLESGLSPQEAHSAAMRRFGNMTLAREESARMWTWRWLENLLQDARGTFRLFRRSPGFCVATILILALGIGANTAVFSLMDAVMLKSLPVQEPGQLVLFGDKSATGSTNDFPRDAASLFSYPFYREVRQKNSVFTDVAAVLSIPLAPYGKMEGSTNPEPFKVQLVCGSYFSMLGVNPILGRALNDQDDLVAGGSPVAVASYSWWKRRLGNDPSALGTKITISETVYTVIGIAPPEFFGTTVGESPDLWIPLAMEAQLSPGWNGLNNNLFQSLYIIARLKSGVSTAEAEANTNLLFKQALRDYAGTQPSKENLEDIQHARIDLTSAASGLSDLRRRFSTSLQVLMAVVALVLLIACANIANLLLARSRVRQRETAIRMAIGAGRSRLIRQFVTESLVLGTIGGMIGVGLAMLGDKLLLAMVSGGPEPVPLSVNIDGRVLGFTLGVSLLTALLFGVVPAIRGTRLDLQRSLKDGRAFTSDRTRNSLAQWLIVVQVALSLILLVGAGLFLRSLKNLSHVNTGFDANQVLTFTISESSAGYKEDGRLEALHKELEERVIRLPGVRAASVSFFTFNEGGWTDPVWTDNNTTTTTTGDSIWHNVVGADYFQAMGIPLLAGRSFGPQDTTSSQKVAIISQNMARTLFPGMSAIGRHFGIEGPTHRNDFEVIGVAGDAKHTSLREPPKMADYFPHSQQIQYLPNFVVRSSADFGSTASAVRRTIREIDGNLPVSVAATLADQVDHSLAREKMIARLCEFFAAIAVFLACVGIYGLMSYAVNRRTSEIGLRMALGATQGGMRWLIVREILVMVAIGLAVGSALALTGGRLLTSLLFGIAPTDGMTIIVAMAVLLSTAVLAGYLPARRASSIDPMIALRYE